MIVFYDMDLPDDEGGGGGGSKVPAAKPTGGAGPLVTTKSTPTAPNNPNAPVIPNRIPLPDYNNPKSRITYAQNITKQYGPLMQNRGDTFLHVNETPDVGPDTATAKEMSVDAAKKLGLDPALLYSSAMEEGMSGLWKGKGGLVKVGENTTDDFPVSGYGNFGLDTFSDKFHDLVKKGYLTPDFAQNFKKQVAYNEKSEPVNSANFKDVGSALQAKAAYMKDNYDDIDSYAKQRGITLSPKARDFFALANYNGGGIGHQMLNDYYNAGQLEGDKFLKGRPTSGGSLKATSYGPLYDKKTGQQTDEGMYDHLVRRLKMRDALYEQSLFDKATPK